VDLSAEVMMAATSFLERTDVGSMLVSRTKSNLSHQ